MSTRTTDLKEAIDHLPADAVLAIEGVTWEEYEQLLDDLGEAPPLRVTYDQGRLEIVTTGPGHEANKEFVSALARILSEELNVELEARGSTTYKGKRYEKGTEPDTCFYVVDVERVIGKESVVDLNVDPPPDIVVELDFASDSRNKFSIYSQFGVPEIWRYVRKLQRCFIYELRDHTYVEIPASCFFPILTAATLTRFVEESKKRGQTKALSSFRLWVREQKGNMAEHMKQMHKR